MNAMLQTKLYVVLILFLVAVFLVSCSDSTQAKKATIVGSVLLEGVNNSEGVKVLLYQAGVVEIELASIHADHPSLGFDIGDKHIFDHRDYAPVYTTTTSSDGSFEIKGVEKDKYILVLLREGFGHRYLYDLELDSDVVEANNGEDIHLFEVIELPQYVDGEFVFETGKTYIANEDAMFLPESKVTFEGGSTLLINPGRGVTCNGSISLAGSVDEPIKITSSDKIYDFGIAPAQFAKFEVTELANVADISGLILTHSTDGMIIKSTNLTLKQSVFARNNTGCMFTLGQSIAVEKSYFVNSAGIIGKGLTLQDVANISLGDCVFYNVENVSLNIVIGQGVTISNCFFTGGQNHILNSFSSQTFVTNSTFSNAQYNLINTAKSTLDTQYNDIEGRVCIYTYHTGNQGNSISNGWTKANNNNFNASVQTVRATAQFYTYQHEYVPLDFSNNFWGTTSQSMIDESIIDYNDLEPYPEPGNIWPLITYVPFRTSRVVNAGVQ